MMRASEAKVEWNPETKRWNVHIQIGAEVIKRPLPKSSGEAEEETLRSQAVETAKDEGYELDRNRVAIVR